MCVEIIKIINNSKKGVQGFKVHEKKKVIVN